MLQKIDGALSGNYCTTTHKKTIQNEVLFALLSGEFSESEIVDMRHFNTRSNSEQSKYNIFFDGMSKMLEFGGLNKNERRHPQGKVLVGGGIMYMPIVTSINDLKKN